MRGYGRHLDLPAAFLPSGSNRGRVAKRVAQIENRIQRIELLLSNVGVKLEEEIEDGESGYAEANESEGGRAGLRLVCGFLVGGRQES